MSAVSSTEPARADTPLQSDRNAVVQALRSIAADISLAQGLLLLGASAPDAEVERVADCLRKDRRWLHARADQLAALSLELLA